jgi:hypothetical protein
MPRVQERCGWCGTDPLYVAYHDTEWGVPEPDGRALWEKLILDGFQAGLAWITILRKHNCSRLTRSCHRHRCAHQRCTYPFAEFHGLSPKLKIISKVNLP